MIRVAMAVFACAIIVTAAPVAASEPRAGSVPGNAALLQQFEQTFASPEALLVRATQLRSVANAVVETGNMDAVYNYGQQYFYYGELRGLGYAGQAVSAYPALGRYLYIETGMNEASAMAAYENDVYGPAEDAAGVAVLPEGLYEIEGFGLSLGISSRTETTFDASRIISGKAPVGTSIFVEVFGYHEASGEFFLLREAAPLRVGASQGFSRMIELEIGRNFVLVTAINEDGASQYSAVINRMPIEVRRELERLLFP